MREYKFPVQRSAETRIIYTPRRKRIRFTINPLIWNTRGAWSVHRATSRAAKILRDWNQVERTDGGPSRFLLQGTVVNVLSPDLNPGVYWVQRILRPRSWPRLCVSSHLSGRNESIDSITGKLYSCEAREREGKREREREREREQNWERVTRYKTGSCSLDGPVSRVSGSSIVHQLKRGHFM